jgi:hypothetical protein
MPGISNEWENAIIEEHNGKRQQPEQYIEVFHIS